MDHAHEIYLNHPTKQRRIGFWKRRRFRNACVGDQDVDRLTACGLRDCSLHRGLIRNIGNTCEMRVARGDSCVQRCTITAEYSDTCSGTCKARCDRAADPPAAAGDKSVGGTRQSRHAQPSDGICCSEHCVYFRRQAFATNVALPALAAVSRAANTGAEALFFKRKLLLFIPRRPVSIGKRPNDQGAAWPHLSP